jgi:hypothetical protein
MYFEKISKSDITHPNKCGRISKIMIPLESLSQYLSNEYQCCGVSIELKNYQYFLHSDFGDKSKR